MVSECVHTVFSVNHSLLKSGHVGESGKCVCFSVTKGCLAASIVFICERQGLIQAEHPVIYFLVVLFFIYFRLSSLLLGIHDPFVPFENLFCAIFMGGIWDALKRAVSREKKTEDSGATVSSRNNAKKED